MSKARKHRPGVRGQARQAAAGGARPPLGSSGSAPLAAPTGLGAAPVPGGGLPSPGHPGPLGDPRPGLLGAAPTGVAAAAAAAPAAAMPTGRPVAPAAPPPLRQASAPTAGAPAADARAATPPEAASPPLAGTALPDRANTAAPGPVWSPAGPRASGRAGRIPVLGVTPDVDGGRWAPKAAVGEHVPIEATVIREGHDALGATAVLLDPGGAEHTRVRMRPLAPGTDRYGATVVPDRPGTWTFRVEGWSDPYGTWRHEADVKLPLGLDVDLVLEEGARLLERAATDTAHPAAAANALRDGARGLRDAGRPAMARLAAGTSLAVRSALQAHPLRDLVTSGGDRPLRVERTRALFSAWYEMFPRSEGAYRTEDGRWVSGTFATAAKRLPAIADMGFDIVYLPPIHPVGTVNRKGPNNSLVPRPGDPGSPWAIGSAAGGHDAVNPELGTLEDFTDFVARARDVGLEVALDLALQCAPDHPWTREHPEWFTTRADGTIAYAENPPKKYQDIYPLNFDNDPAGLAAEVLRVVRHWIDAGVTVFRVDNPHTKPVAFWEWLIGTVNAERPDILFLAEAFTRPAMMHTLGKVGFQQSYTYFTWRDTKQELTEYVTSLAQESADYMRPNFWPNTPDILPGFLQAGGPAAFALRAVLAATLVPSWGMYAGYELYENAAVRAGSEEYLDSEKYDYRPRDWDAHAIGGPRAGETLAPLISALNRIRREHPALQQLRNVQFHQTDSDHLLCYSRHLPLDPADPTGPADTVVVVVNLDPHAIRDGFVHLDPAAFGLDPDARFAVEDLLSPGEAYSWGRDNYVRLDPTFRTAHVMHVRRS